MPSPAIILRADREKPVQNQHPWVFSGAVASITGSPQPGEIVEVLNHTGRFLARGYYNPRSQIQVRILTWHDEPITSEWWARAIERAVAGRAALFRAGSDAYRLIHAESDYLPGLIVDRYGDWLVLQALTLGIDQRKEELAKLLREITGARGVYERSDVDVRGKEGLKPVTGLLSGAEPPERITIHEPAHEGDLALWVDVRRGHKTGYYLDQRENRALAGILAHELAAGGKPPRVLNLFSYSGGFAIHALKAGAIETVNVDASRDVLELAEANLTLNHLPVDRAELLQGDAFAVLRDYAAAGKQFDIIICDPPKFAHSAGQIERAARGYKDLNLHCFHLLSEGGLLLTFSCSGAIDAELFTKIVFGALADSGRQAQILRHLEASSDHPVALTFPEGRYLKGLLLRVY